MTTRKGNESIIQKENCFVDEIEISSWEIQFKCLNGRWRVQFLTVLISVRVLCADQIFFNDYLDLYRFFVKLNTFN